MTRQNFIKKLWGKTLGKIAIILLLIAIIVVIFGSICFDGTAESIIINIATEAIGIALTYFLIDWFISNENEKNRERIQKIAINSIRNSLFEHFVILFEIYKVSSDKLDAETAYNLKWLKSSDYLKTIRNFDITKDYNKKNSVIWKDYIQENFYRMDIVLGQVLDRYATYLEETQISNIQSLIMSEFMYRFNNSFSDDEKKALFSNDIGEITYHIDIFVGFCINNAILDNRLLFVLDTSYLDISKEPLIGSAKLN